MEEFEAKAKAYRIAGKEFIITSLYNTVHEQCANYLYDSPCNAFVIHMGLDDIEKEQQRNKHTELSMTIGKQPEAYLESLAVFRRIAEWMPTQGTVLFHCSAISVDDCCYVFTAASGTGKSTHTRLWREMLGERAVMVNDDKPLIHVNEDGSAIVYGTPWDGKHHLSSNIAVPLKAICILQRDTTNHIERISKREAYPMLLQQTYRPADPVALRKTLEILDRLDTSFYRLGCNMDPEAARVSYENMRDPQSI